MHGSYFLLESFIIQIYKWVCGGVGGARKIQEFKGHSGCVWIYQVVTANYMSRINDVTDNKSRIIDKYVILIESVDSGYITILTKTNAAPFFNTAYM